MNLVNCTMCGEMKPTIMFSKDKRKKNRSQCQCHCKECATKEIKAWRRRYPERQKILTDRYAAKHPERHLKTKFGIDPLEKRKIFESQDRACAACGIKDHGNPRISGETGWCLDHDHSTGMIRGVLCWGCNMALGFVKDSEDRLINLAGYLKTHTTVNTLIAGVGLTHEFRRETVSEMSYDEN